MGTANSTARSSASASTDNAARAQSDQADLPIGSSDSAVNDADDESFHNAVENLPEDDDDNNNNNVRNNNEDAPVGVEDGEDMLIVPDARNEQPQPVQIGVGALGNNDIDDWAMDDDWIMDDDWDMNDEGLQLDNDDEFLVNPMHADLVMEMMDFYETHFLRRALLGGPMGDFRNFRRQLRAMQREMDRAHQPHDAAAHL